MGHLVRPGGVELEYEVRRAGMDAGTGSSPSHETFVFLHGMGGDHRQPLGYLGSDLGVDVVAMDARGHGGSTDIGAAENASFAVFAEDVLALLDHLELRRAHIGGISMGAAIAAAFAAAHPERVTSLVVCRPAWLGRRQAPGNVEAYTSVAELLDEMERGMISTQESFERLLANASYQAIAAVSADAASSLRHQLTRPRAVQNAYVLRRLPVNGPFNDVDSWTTLSMPAVVIGHRDDPVHPWGIAEEIARSLPNASLVETVSKDSDHEGFYEQVGTAISEFLPRGLV